MSQRFQGRTALITGGGSGIGLAVARGWCAEGGRAVLAGRTLERLESAALGLPSGAALPLAGDHGRPAFAEEAVRRARDTFGSVDLLFNNAGSYDRSSVAECSPEEWEHALRSNLTGPFLLTRAVLPDMRARGGGVIVNNASTLALRPVPGTAPYAVAKAGLLQLTRATALEEAGHGIRANAVCPGVVETPMHDRGTLEAAAGLHPLGRVGTAEEVAELVLFLASDASAWTTGSAVTIDGGISLA